METKIGPEVAHVTRDLDTTFKVKRSKVSVKGAGAYYGGLPPTACSFCQSYTPVYMNCRLLRKASLDDLRGHDPIDGRI